MTAYPNTTRKREQERVSNISDIARARVHARTHARIPPRRLGGGHDVLRTKQSAANRGAHAPWAQFGAEFGVVSVDSFFLSDTAMPKKKRKKKKKKEREIEKRNRAREPGRPRGHDKPRMHVNSVRYLCWGQSRRQQITFLSPVIQRTIPTRAGKNMNAR